MNELRYFRDGPQRLPPDQFFHKLTNLGWTGCYGGSPMRMIGYIPPGGEEVVPLRTLLHIGEATQMTWRARFWCWYWSWV